MLTRPYRGILRKEDVRAIDKDNIQMYKCFRPGDIILARVVSFYITFMRYRHYSSLTLECFPIRSLDADDRSAYLSTKYGRK